MTVSVELMQFSLVLMWPCKPEPLVVTLLFRRTRGRAQRAENRSSTWPPGNCCAAPLDPATESLISDG